MKTTNYYTNIIGIFLDSSMVEHSAVNRVVVGSSPTRGAVRESADSFFVTVCPAKLDHTCLHNKMVTIQKSILRMV